MDAVYLHYDDYEDGACRLTVRADAQAFAGRVEAFVSTKMLITFASELATYPLAGHVVLDIAGPARARLDCYPVDAQGHIRVDIQLASEGLAVTTVLATSYANIERFARAIHGAISGSGEPAILVAD